MCIRDSFKSFKTFRDFSVLRNLYCPINFLPLNYVNLTLSCDAVAVSYTHLRAHETDSYLVCRLLLEKNVHILSVILFFYLFFINPKEEEILDLLQEVENDVLHAVDDSGRLIPRGPAVIFFVNHFYYFKGRKFLPGKKFNEKFSRKKFTFHKNHKTFFHKL